MSERTALIIQIVLMLGLVAIGFVLGWMYRPHTTARTWLKGGG